MKIGEYNAAYCWHLFSEQMRIRLMQSIRQTLNYHRFSIRQFDAENCRDGLKSQASIHWCIYGVQTPPIFNLPFGKGREGKRGRFWREGKGKGKGREGGQSLIFTWIDASA